MNSVDASYKPDASGAGPKQLGYLPNLELNDGNEILTLAYGLGTANYKSKDMIGKVDKKVIADTVQAIKCGYYHLDGADGYGNEEELGEAIKQAGVPREKLYVVTKCTKVPGPDGNDKELQAKWAQMEAIKASGKARSIGVSNFLQQHLDAVLQTATVPPAINQIEYHPYLQHGDLLAYHCDKKIAVSAYAPLTAVRKAKPGPLDAVYESLANKYGVGEGDVALRWVIDQGLVVITTSSSEERLKSFLTKLPSFKLTPREVDEAAVKGREKHYRGFWNHKFQPEDHS
ncbi:unnamed protein product [Discula destructiva]